LPSSPEKGPLGSDITLYDVVAAFEAAIQFSERKVAQWLDGG
jgi:hypothetical protein